jgi:uncharacterized protein (DUF2267 family)
MNETLGNYIKRKVKHRSLNFEAYAAEGNHFINAVAAELALPRNSAARITRAVLHAVRDRIPPDDALEFAQGLPMALKGVYIDQYDPSDKPYRIRRADDFLDLIYTKNELAAGVDFPGNASIKSGLRGVFRVLQNYMDRGQVEQIKYMMGDDIRMMIDGYD